MQQKKYRIHPAIGIARLGNSTAPDDTGYFIGPEVPSIDFVPAPNGTYRDAAGSIRRQAARFRVYELCPMTYETSVHGVLGRPAIWGYKRQAADIPCGGKGIP